MKVNLNCRFVAKLGLLVVLIGFFMPLFSGFIGSGRNGFEIAKSMLNNDNRVLGGLLLYVVMASAVGGALIGCFLLLKKKVNPVIDWVAIIACIASGLFVYFNYVSNGSLTPKLQVGAYVILAGWVIALGAQIYSKLKKEK